jgi:CRISPR-associated protein Csb2
MCLTDSEEVGDVSWVSDDNQDTICPRVSGVDTEHLHGTGATETGVSAEEPTHGDSDQRTQQEAEGNLKGEFGSESPLRSLPSLSHHQKYGHSRYSERAEPLGSTFSPSLVVFSLKVRDGPSVALGLRLVRMVIERWREALVSRSSDMPDPVREIVSGHRRDGAPLEGPHLAFVPMAFVGSSCADGHLLGLAAALPVGLPAEERQQVLCVLGRVSELRLGPLGVWGLVRKTGTEPPWNLRADTWTAYPDGATHWSTVTPIAFDRHPKAKEHGACQREIAQMIAAACTAVGLPQPREVVVTPVSAHLGVPPAYAFPRLPRKDGGDRRHSHAILVFDQPVRGPVLIGAGRYRGYGVCRPLDAE